MGDPCLFGNTFCFSLFIFAGLDLCANLKDIMSKLSQAMTMLINVFYEYSDKEGDKLNLTKRELKDLINNELGESIKSSSNQEQADKILKDLDTDPNGVMDFPGYATQLAHITMASSNFFTDKK